ncbi:hypothetical protein [Pseudaquabacterium pictum]|uniref:Uncharacterized protein n=1 Tax=Pseudaquabacterium pictum TaxID=2315236 RepID=A0A480AX10_9BURK|nr:hypothetical protein [Rubrivivax pictus]GCL64335.1 hypothetical protein AQPW35_34160 [Rubrivivax pictus]
MRAPRNSVLPQIVAVAWVRGYVDHITVRAIIQCSHNAVGARIHGAIAGGHLVELPGHKPKRWGLTPERLDAIRSMPTQAELRVLAEQTAQKVQRIAAIQAAEREERVAARRAALARAATDQAQARKAKREAARAATAAARAEAKAARQQALDKARAAATREPSAGQRPPLLPGSQMLVPPPAGAAPGVVVRDQALQLAQQPVQDPKGLLTPRPQPAAGAAPILLRGGLLAPADGPYIRPGAQAHQAVLSRRGDALVPHRPPLSQP